MFDASYTYKFITKKNPLSEDFYLSKSIFSFEAEKYRYIAEVELYPQNMYVIKFFQKTFK